MARESCSLCRPHFASSQALTFPPGSVERMLYIAAFAVSGYASTAGRTNKPFNPLLGETYELVYPEKVSSPARPLPLRTCCEAVSACRL